MRGLSVDYHDRVMVTCYIPNCDSVVTGVVVFRRHGPPTHGPIYTVVLDAPLIDGRCMVEAGECHLLVLAPT